MRKIITIAFSIALLASCSSGKYYANYRKGGHKRSIEEHAVRTTMEPSNLAQVPEPKSNPESFTLKERVTSYAHSENKVESYPLIGNVKKAESVKVVVETRKAEKLENKGTGIDKITQKKHEEHEGLFSPRQKLLLTLGAIIGLSYLIAVWLSIGFIWGLLILLGGSIALIFIYLLCGGYYMV